MLARLGKESAIRHTKPLTMIFEFPFSEGPGTAVLAAGLVADLVETFFRIPLLGAAVTALRGRPRPRVEVLRFEMISPSDMSMLADMIVVCVLLKF